jgi:hypothetical protein
MTSAVAGSCVINDISPATDPRDSLAIERTVPSWRATSTQASPSITTNRESPWCP